MDEYCGIIVGDVAGSKDPRVVAKSFGYEARDLDHARIQLEAGIPAHQRAIRILPLDRQRVADEVYGKLRALALELLRESGANQLEGGEVALWSVIVRSGKEYDSYLFAIVPCK